MTKLPLTKGYHVVISSRDMDLKKNQTRICHLGWYQLVKNVAWAHGLLSQLVAQAHHLVANYFVFFFYTTFD